MFAENCQIASLGAEWEQIRNHLISTGTLSTTVQFASMLYGFVCVVESFYVRHILFWKISLNIKYILVNTGIL